MAMPMTVRPEELKVTDARVELLLNQPKPSVFCVNSCLSFNLILSTHRPLSFMLRVWGPLGTKRMGGDPSLKEYLERIL